MIKLSVSDLDGTLLPYGEDSLSDEVISLIEEILSLGVVFAVSSGRTYGELLRFLPMFRGRIFFTCCDGALTVKDEKVLYTRKIETNDIDYIFRSKSKDMSFLLHGAFDNYCFGDIPSDAEKFCAKSINGIYDIKDKIFKITTYGDKLDLPEYSGLRTHWDGGEFKMAQYANRYCNKGTALSDLQMRLMLTGYDTVVLGDRGNDICMTKGAKFSYCIGDRCAELISASTYHFKNGSEALSDIIKYLKT